MRALVFDHTGDLGALRVEERPQPRPADGDVLVEIHAASINPSDLVNVRGGFPHTTVPRTPGRDFAGVVVAGSPELVGASVWGAGGELGFRRDGSHATHVMVEAAAVAPLPKGLTFVDAAAAGIPFITAWTGLHDAARVMPGDWVLVTGANGSVGTAVVQLARWTGAFTIGLDVAQPSSDVPAQLRADLTVTNRDELHGALQRAGNGGSVDIVFDTVGEAVFADAIAALRADGRYAIISAVSGRSAAFDILDFYRRNLTLLGVDSSAIDGPRAARLLRRVGRGFAAGTLHAPHVDRTVSLDEAPRAYAALASREFTGKTVIVPVS
ncbi:MAG TPA: zinc-binding alcohol dehydrogenase family protein [Candidatus Acidoferrum sp.]|nr:zinc-binding alcohol dehydrogenase family protein [Candidatus Acidoferrum sp.]